MVKTEKFAQVQVESADELRRWLAEHHGQEAGVWVVTFKKDTGARYVSRSAVLDELLCFGWIDGIARKLDDERTMQLITPRRAQHWARSYKERVSRLTEQGRMHPAGLRSVEESKARGLWTFMDDVDDLIVPEDLAVALAARAGARSYFDTIPPASKRFTLRWIKLAKTPATRAKRITTMADLAASGQRLPGS